MKIQYHGEDAVDIPGHDNVQPGHVVEVDDEVGASLLAAGTSYPVDEHGEPLAPVPPEKPLWKAAGKKAAVTTTDPADAENGEPS